MKQLFSVYPAGLAGFALLLLRCSLALVLTFSASEFFDLRSWPALLVDGLAIALVAGFATRIIAASASVAGVLVLVANDHATLIFLAGRSIDALALALIGPGAYSIDAALYGRATINLPR
ncbi:hypothetical protein WBQ88_15820 [Sphingopyxis sp. CCNWLW253]